MLIPHTICGAGKPYVLYCVALMYLYCDYDDPLSYVCIQSVPILDITLSELRQTFVMYTIILHE